MLDLSFDNRNSRFQLDLWKLLQDSKFSYLWNLLNQDLLINRIWYFPSLRSRIIQLLFHLTIRLLSRSTICCLTLFLSFEFTKSPFFLRFFNQNLLLRIKINFLFRSKHFSSRHWTWPCLTLKLIWFYYRINRPIFVFLCTFPIAHFIVDLASSSTTTKLAFRLLFKVKTVVEINTNWSSIEQTFVKCALSKCGLASCSKLNKTKTALLKSLFV